MKEERLVGIWLDSKEAFCVGLKGDNVTEEKIESGIETRERFEGEGKDSMRMGDQYSVPESKKRAHLEAGFKAYFKSLSNRLDKEDKLVVFGPGEVPAAFKNHLVSDKGWNSSTIELKKADSMSDNQKTAWVKKHFGKLA